MSHPHLHLRCFRCWKLTGIQSAPQASVGGPSHMTYPESVGITRENGGRGKKDGNKCNSEMIPVHTETPSRNIRLNHLFTWTKDVSLHCNASGTSGFEFRCEEKTRRCLTLTTHRQSKSRDAQNLIPTGFLRTCCRCTRPMPQNCCDKWAKGLFGLVHNLHEIVKTFQHVPLSSCSPLERPWELRHSHFETTPSWRFGKF